MPWMPASRESCHATTPPRTQAGRRARGGNKASVRLSRRWRRAMVQRRPQKEHVPWR